MTTLKYGRRPPKNHPALQLADILTGTVPSHPATADNLAAPGWAMLGNDQYGDCVAVTWANYRRLMTRLAGAEHYPDWNAVETFYRTQNPNFPTDDQGMDIQTALEALVTDGGPDGVKAVAFAKVDYSKPDEVKAAVAIFGAVWVGINVQAAQMDQFNAGQPWDYVAGSADDGGHSIITGGYGGGTGVLAGDERFVTWAQETSFTDAFWGRQVEECWVVVWPENLGTAQFEQGVDSAALAVAYHDLTGKTLNIPTPTPAPSPTPQPTPSPTPQPGPGTVERTFTADDVNLLDGWAEQRHTGCNKKAAQAWKRGEMA